VGDSEQVTIMNKKRDQFGLLVGAGLTLKNIVIDSIDSIIHRKTPLLVIRIIANEDSKKCLRTRSQCCSVATGSYLMTDNGNYGCTSYFKAYV